MKTLIFVIAIVILPSLFFKQPSSSGQSKEAEVISLPTPEQKQARILGAENDKRSLALNNEYAIAAEKTKSNEKLRIEAAKYKKLVITLEREKQYYKEKLALLKKNLMRNQPARGVVLDNDYFADSTLASNCKKDTVYLIAPRKKFFKNLFKH